MTRQNSQPAREPDTFEERIEILAKELELAIKWRRPCVLLVVYSSDYVRADVETALANFLIDLGQKTASLRIKSQNTNDIVSFLSEFTDPANTVFFIEGLRWAHGRDASIYTALNLQRDFLVERQARVIFWLTHNEIVDLAHHAPDFWACRHRVIEFAESPKAERVLQGALESAWQGIGEYSDQYEDTDAKISFRESLLVELPREEEASSTRANLLLTLGILNWRKGDYEKADELLCEALKIATKMQDTWFEAECFNAIALVKTSIDRIDEAIHAYKQAIQLAPDQIFAWNNLGNLCAKTGRNDEAIVVFQKAIECNPKDPIGWNGLGNVYSKIGYVDDAIAAYRKSIQFMPTFAHPWNGLGDVYASVNRTDEALMAYSKAIELNKHYALPWLRLGALFNKQGRHREAVKAYRKALTLDSRNAAIWNELGTIHLKSDAYEEAAEAFSKAIEYDRGYGWSYSNLALTYTQQGKYNEALPLYLRSVDLLKDDKDKAISWNRLADVYRLLNDYDNAIAAYQSADMLEPGTSSSKNRRGNPSKPESSATGENRNDRSTAVKTTDKPAEAAEKVLEDLAARPKDVIPEGIVDKDLSDAPYWIFNPDSNSHIEISTASNNNESAKSPEPIGVAMHKPTSFSMPENGDEPVKVDDPDGVFGKVRENNTNPFVWNEKGNIHFKQQDYDEAICAYNKAIQLDSSFGWPYCNLALTYLIQGQYAEAILLYQKSIELLKTNGDKAISWNGLGNVYRYINDYPNAIAAYQKAAELDPETAGMRDGADSFQISQSSDNTDMWNDLGELFFRTGAFVEAINAFKKAIELEPASGWAYNNLAYVLASQSQYTEAIPFYRKSIDLLQDNKDKAVVWNRLGNAYRKINDYDHAMEAYEQAALLADEGSTLLNRTRLSLLSNCYVNQ